MIGALRGPVLRQWLALALALAGSGCATLTASQRDDAAAIAAAARSSVSSCATAGACASPSPLRALAATGPAGAAARGHQALILDYGQDALLARLNLIRAATTSIDLQTYIFDEDDAGHMVLDELLTAARRGVRVRVLVDQLSALRKVETLAALAGVHANFEMRVYNPVLGRARISYPQYVLAAACCWRRLNQRMHSKLLLVDGMVGITGGRNYQDDYFDWNGEYNFRDRDLLVTGPVTGAMAANFDAFWDDRRSTPIARLADVGRRLLDAGVPVLPHPEFTDPERVARMSRDADDQLLVGERLASLAMPVEGVSFIADLPQKHRRSNEAVAPSTAGLRELIESARSEVLLQTPYLVLSRPAQQLFRELQARPRPPQVVVSTNSLASTDSFITYALSYKYKRRYLRDFGFRIHEFKPFPEDAPIDVDATGAVDIGWDGEGNPVIGAAADADDAPASTDRLAAAASGSGSGVRGASSRRRERSLPLEREYSALRYAGLAANRPVPLQRAGVRIGMHAKSLVIDEQVGVVGTHNFDPRGDRYNTESAVVIADPRFARALAASIRRDIQPGNSWVIARRDKPPVFSGLEYSLAKVSEQLPVFDLWPVRYATSYEFVPGPGCPRPLPPDDPGFRACHEPVGDFPEVRLGLKSLLTRIFTAFGAGLAPIL